MLKYIQTILLLSAFAIIICACTKEEYSVSDYEIQKPETYTNLVAQALHSSASSAESNCSPHGIPNTTFGLFLNRAVDANIDMNEADYFMNGVQGIAYFRDIEEGEYHIVAQNIMGIRVCKKTIEFGSNELIINY